MAIFDIFSKREQRRSGSKPDVFVYDSIPKELRVQIVHVLADLLGKYNLYESPAQWVYKSVHDALAREYGLFRLAEGSDFEDMLFNFILQTPALTRVLDAIELSLAFVAIQMSRMYSYKQMAASKIEDPKVAIDELNRRFLEAGIGYQYEIGEFVKVDLQILQSAT